MSMYFVIWAGDHNIMQMVAKKNITVLFFFFTTI